MSWISVFLGKVMEGEVIGVLCVYECVSGVCGVCLVCLTECVVYKCVFSVLYWVCGVFKCVCGVCVCVCVFGMSYWVCGVFKCVCGVLQDTMGGMLEANTTRTTIVIKLKKEVDIMLSPMALESAQLLLEVRGKAGRKEGRDL